MFNKTCGFSPYMHPSDCSTSITQAREWLPAATSLVMRVPCQDLSKFSDCLNRASLSVVHLTYLQRSVRTNKRFKSSTHSSSAVYTEHSRRHTATVVTVVYALTHSLTILIESTI